MIALGEPRTPDGDGIALVGYRGTGKSTVGRLVARRLGMEFIDTDAEIGLRAKMPVAEVFRLNGEPAFRDMEERVILDCAGLRGLVLATGGGAVLRERNVRTLRDFGRVVWLTGAPEVLADRLRHDPADRPALTSAGPIDEIAAVLRSRELHYRLAADFAVETDGLSPAEVADRVVGGWRAARPGQPR